MATDSSATNVNEKLLNKLTKQYQTTENNLVKQSTKWLNKIEKQELKLKAQLAKTDSAKAQQIFGNVNDKYDQLKKSLHNKTKKLNAYYPNLDSLGSASKFLQKINGNKITNNLQLPTQQVNTTITSLQQKLQNATNIKKQIQQRKEELKEALKNTPIARQLDKYKKQVFYYQQQLNEYKTLLNSPDKLVAKALNWVRENNSFKQFFSQNSSLALLFSIPNSSATTVTNGSTALVGGLQSRASVMQAVQQSLGISTATQQLGNVNPANLLSSKIDAGKAALDNLKSKMPNGDNVQDSDMPNFKPNTQKTKSFLKRLEFGYTIQNQQSNYWLPTTSDIAATVGYKLNDKATVGLGIAYKLGWGTAINNIKITHQGFGFRSFIDIKCISSKNQNSAFNFFTKNLWITGGYEINYLPQLNGLPLKPNAPTINPNLLPTAWQQAALLGISKKQKVAKKTISLQVLYNFLYNKTIPNTPQFVFRIGWSK
jgi:hypothetical protein